MKAIRIITLFLGLFISGSLFSQEILISQGGTVSNCGGTITDSGGAANPYGSFEIYEMTLCSTDPSQCLSLEFLSFETVEFSDVLYVYDGISTTAPSFNPSGFGGNLGPFTLEASGDCITLQWFAFSGTPGPGFEANINCSPCPTCTDGIQNGTETGIDCGGSTCAPCPCDDFIVSTIPYSDSNTTCGMTNDYDNGDACFSFFMNGNDVVYEYTATASVCLEVTLDYPTNPGSAGLSIMDGCPDWPMTNCIANSTSIFMGTSITSNLNVMAGETYYIVVSSDIFQAPCIDYTINLEEGVPTNQDCLGAIPVCDLIVTNPQIQMGSGSCLDIDPLSLSCLTGGELNSVWYTFGTANTGNLNFTLTPDNLNDDFDWALYNITGGMCSDIIDDPTTLVSCNSYGVIGVNGPTGISSGLGGIGNSNGPGNLNGPAFNADLAVVAGQTYALMISNWSGSTNGITLDFSSSDPGIFGFEAPNLNESITSAYCSLANGAIDISGITGGLPPYDAVLNSVPQTGLVFSNLLPGTYDIEITSGSQCVFDYVLSVGDNAITTNAGNDTTECDLDVDILGEELTGFTGTWSGPADVNFDDASSANATASSSIGGVLTLTWTIDDGDGCIISDEIQVTFTDTINIQVDEFEESCYQYCDGAAHVFPSGGSGTTNYNYFFTSGTAGTLTNEIELLCPGSHDVTVIDENGCVATQSFNITAADIFVIEDLIEINETCPGDCDGQIIVNAPMATNFSSDGGLSFVADSVLSNLCPGTYNLVAQTDENCITNGEGIVGENNPPVADFDIEPNEASVFEANFTVFDDSEGGEGFLDYQWFFGTEGQSDLVNPSYTFLNAEIGEHPITLLLTDSLGCQDTIVKFINITEDFHIFAPNSFTPDGDGVNEFFYIVGSDIDDRNFEMEIYDRFGHTVFFTNDPTERWNGSDEDNDYFVNVSIYNWRIKTKRLSSFDEVEMFGQVTLIR